MRSLVTANQAATHFRSVSVWVGSFSSLGILYTTRARRGNSAIKIQRRSVGGPLHGGNLLRREREATAGHRGREVAAAATKIELGGTYMITRRRRRRRRHRGH